MTVEQLPVRVADLERDPYPIYARLRATAPMCRVDALGMWYVTSYEDVRAILLDTRYFTTASEHSLIFDTFGAHMLTTEGAQHDRYRSAVQHAFTPNAVRQRFEAGILAAATRLIEEFRARGEVELRSAFAARLPVLTILAVFGLPDDVEPRMRRWYDAFERALSNFTLDPAVRTAAHTAVAEFHDYLRGALETAANGDNASLLSSLVNAPAGTRLSDEEIMRNMSIIFFGGISTVEALILNALYALFTHPEVMRRVRADSGLLPKVIDETMRWMSPVQSATRHVVSDTQYKGIPLRAGEIVNCMVGAANRDPAVFTNPEVFDLDRANSQRHIGFATGPHSCLGFQLAKAEARIALGQLLRMLPNLEWIESKSSEPEGYEFRQPRCLQVSWSAS